MDNADELPPRALNPYLPTDGSAPGRGHILITSRNPNWGGLVGPEAILPLDTFTRAESLAFLRTRVPVVRSHVRSRQFIAVEGDESPTTNEEEAEMDRLAAREGEMLRLHRLVQTVARDRCRRNWRSSGRKWPSK
ncbi:MAG TPA: hypothetical protein PLD25_17615 [Chloroflexota bacterium]|nr:hypothetical protein [Chloroflexota bacterium]